MAEQTVREEMAAALEEITRREGAYNRDPRIHAENTIDNMERIARRALARHRAEPKTHHREDLLVALDEMFASDNPTFVGWDGWWVAKKAFRAAISELQCPDGCDTSCRCYQEGLEAQRERVG